MRERERENLLETKEGWGDGSGRSISGEPGWRGTGGCDGGGGGGVGEWTEVNGCRRGGERKGQGCKTRLGKFYSQRQHQIEGDDFPSKERR